MMTALLPRLFGDMNDWFDTEFLPRTHPIRIEQSLTDQDYTLRAVAAPARKRRHRQITATYDKGILTVTVPPAAPAPAGKQIPITTTAG
jgi:hypothetical protein